MQDKTIQFIYIYINIITGSNTNNNLKVVQLKQNCMNDCTVYTRVLVTTRSKQGH
jgi:hypothetical protein